MANLQANSVISRSSKDLLRVVRGVYVDIFQGGDENKVLWILIKKQQKSFQFISLVKHIINITVFLANVCNMVDKLATTELGLRHQNLMS